ncbi:MAG: glycine cleavage system aminomethyltransferase GcvT [Candidatus Eisenbacteria bacterium]|nr:glycine cleavage system aminomethyltransferase GcvT [Candidatus Eisenbacteria bacterium]
MGLRRTPLYDAHCRAGGKLVEFNGWEMPVQYAAGILREHEAVRTVAGIFDVSHMARFEVRGPGSLPFVDRLITNDLGKLEVGRMLYTPMCAESGGVLDDVTVYRMSDRILVVVNAGNRERIWPWLETQRAAWNGAAVELVDRSADLAQIALQGPRAQELLRPHCDGDLDQIGYYAWARLRLFGHDEVLISRNGYTGEDGFEIYPPAAAVDAAWASLLATGGPAGLLPAGLGCRDTLRLEMAYCLYGNELDLETTPLEARLAWTVKLKKDAFVGRAALEAQKAAGLKRALVGLSVTGQRLPRKGQSLAHAGATVGVVASGGFSPSLKAGIALGFVPTELSRPGTKLEVDVRGERVAVEVTEVPFYKHASHR